MKLQRFCVALRKTYNKPCVKFMKICEKPTLCYPHKIK